jgi:hypothetical protein
MTGAIASPVVERFAIASLDDADLTAATEALRYLRVRGSALAQRPIFDRLVRWNAKWRDRIPDLMGTPGQPNPNYRERSFGPELAQTLVSGYGWLADEASIRQVVSLVLEPNSSASAALLQLEESPIHIYFMGTNDHPSFSIAQYQLDAVDALKLKLSQYPIGTRFVWSDHRYNSDEAADHRVSQNLAQWSAVRGVHIEGL